MANILICGYGNIGQHIYQEFKSKVNHILIYDKYKELYNDEDILNNNFDCVFICVPTEKLADGHADVSEVIDIVEKIRLNAKVIIIKSAVPVGTCKSLGYSNIVISPETYGTTQHSLEYPNYAILGGSDYFTHIAAQIYQTVKDGSFRFIFVSHETAELAKYMENCWLATKVTFCNEFASIGNKLGIDYAQLRECFIADPRVNPSHTFVYDDAPFYNSHCLNKDIPAIIKFCDDKDIDTPLLDNIDKINTDRRRRKE